MTEYFRGKFFIDGEFKDRYLEVENGKIKNIGIERGNGTVRTLEGFILPAGVDIHVHFRDPGEERKEDFHSGSRCAIYGGTSTVADMPNNIKPINSQEVFNEKLKTITGRSFTDFALYQLPAGYEIDGAIGQKVFMGKSTGGIISDLTKIINNEKIKVFHAENQSCLDKYKIDDKDLKAHDNSRPLECELEAVEIISRLSLNNVLIAHATSRTVAEISKSFGFRVEVTPHHLLLNRDMKLGSLGKVNPPLRKNIIQEDLMNYLSKELIDVVSSDHAPHTLEEKEVFDSAPSGMPGVETRLPLILMLFKRGIINLNYAVKLLSTNPAEIIGIPKGRIAPGYDADLVIVDFEEEPIKSENLHYKCRWTAFEGFNGIFPNGLILRGEEVMIEREIVEQPRGEFIDGKRGRSKNN